MGRRKINEPQKETHYPDPLYCLKYDAPRYQQLPGTQLTMPEAPMIAGLTAVRIIRDDKALDVNGCLVKYSDNGRTQLCMNTFVEAIDCHSKAAYYGVVNWKCEGSARETEIKFEVKKQMVESDGEKASYCIKLDKKLKKELLHVVPVQSHSFFIESALFIVTHKNEIIEAAMDKIDNTAIQLKDFRVPRSLMKGCPIYDVDMKVVGLVKDKKLGVIWNASWFSEPNRADNTFIRRIFRKTKIFSRRSQSNALQNRIQIQLPCSMQDGEYYIEYYDIPYDEDGSGGPTDVHVKKTVAYEDQQRQSQVEVITSSFEEDVYEEASLEYAGNVADVHVKKTEEFEEVYEENHHPAIQSIMGRRKINEPQKETHYPDPLYCLKYDAPRYQQLPGKALLSVSFAVLR